MDTKGLIELIKAQSLQELQDGIVTLEILEAALQQYQDGERFEVCEGIKQAIDEFKK